MHNHQQEFVLMMEGLYARFNYKDTSSILDLIRDNKRNMKSVLLAEEPNDAIEQMKTAQILKTSAEELNPKSFNDDFIRLNNENTLELEGKHCNPPETSVHLCRHPRKSEIHSSKLILSSSFRSLNGFTSLLGIHQNENSERLYFINQVIVSIERWESKVNQLMQEINNLTDITSKISEDLQIENKKR